MVKVLIVDDSALMRAVLKNFVSKEGHDIIEATNGNDAVTSFKTNSPNLVFMDILMPNGMDGLEAAREIKKIDSSAKIIMVTSLKEKQNIETANEIGVSGYITKPFSKDEILEILRSNL